MTRLYLTVLWSLALLIASCADGDDDASYVSLAAGDAGFDELITEFDDYPIYWVGDEFGGHQLRFVIRDGITISFIYGECGPVSDGGCPPPLQIRTEQFCMESPPLGYRGWPTGLEKVRGQAEFRVRDSLQLWTGGVMVRVFASPDLFDGVLAALNTSNGVGATGVASQLLAPSPDCSDFDWARPASG